MKRLLCILLILNITASFASNTTYYVDKINGNDKNSGKNTRNAWKTLDNLNKTHFEPGDEIYLKRGQVFEGSLLLKGVGSNGHPIKLGAYGSGKRPIINSSGHDYALQIMDAAYWEIADLEATGSHMAGIFMGCTRDDLILNHLRITNCYVHDIGDTARIDWDFSKSTGGIIVVNGTIDNEGKPVFYNSVFNDVIINNCTVRYNHRWTCLSISSGKINGKGGNANYIKNCTAEYSSADGIRMNGVQNSFIEYCVMYRNGAWPIYPGKNLGGLGAWFFDSEDCTIQFCEASHVQAATTDGGAFDIDYYQKNSTVQYCYGHDCAGYGVSVFGADDANRPTENSIVRYNIFSNNGRDPAFAFQGDFFVFTWGGGLLNGVKIYNNTSYWNPAIDTPALKCDADFTGSNPNIFANNIIYSKTKQLVYLKNDTLQCDNNIYWLTENKTPQWKRKDKKYFSLSDWQNNTGNEKHSQYIDPLLIDPGYHDRGLPTMQFNLKPGSPAINAGVALEDMGKRDFYGNTIPDKSGKYDIGAFEWGSNTSKQGTNNKMGARAPGFELPTINNKTAGLKEFSGNTILLSFIDVNNSSGIQSQLTFIRSMKKQYGEKGLKIILIDATPLFFESQPGQAKVGNPVRGVSPNEMLSNFIEDYELDDLVFLVDNKREDVAGKYEVNIFPTTFLVSKDGSIKHKWENVALSSELAMAIEIELGDALTVRHFGD